MKSVFSLLIAGSLAGAPVFAQTNEQPAQLNFAQRQVLRVKRDWTKLILASMNKNEYMFGLANAGNRPKKVAVGMVNTAVVSGLIAATAKIADDEITRAAALQQNKLATPAMGGYRKEILKSNKIIATAKTRKAFRMARPEDAEAITAAMTRRTAAREMLASRRLSNVHRTALGFGLVMGVGLAITLAEDLGVTWWQVAVDPKNFDAKKAEYEEFVRYADQQLAGYAE